MLQRLKVKESTTLKDFLAEKLSISKAKAKQLIDSKNVLVNNQRVWIATHRLKPGDVVELPQVKEEKKEISVLYEDEYIIAVNKPAFLLSDKDKNSVEAILQKKFSKDIKAIHRLDKETSGVLLFAKNYEIFEVFKKNWDELVKEKVYLALSYNKATFKDKVIDIPIDGKTAVSFVKTLKTSSNFSKFLAKPKTGRKHQIRIHLSKVGHPIIGDKVYGYKTVLDPVLKQVGRQMLHSQRLDFFHPFKKKKLSISADIPADFKLLEKKLKLS